MNERIRELLKQAGFDVERLIAPYPGGFPREDMLALESFAELIVQECSKVIEAHFEPVYDGKLIKQHFGVES